MLSYRCYNKIAGVQFIKKCMSLNTTIRTARCMPSQSSKLVDSYVSGTSELPLLGITVGTLLKQSVEKYCNNPAISVTYQGIKKSYSQLMEDVNNLALGFLTLGFQKGDRVGICAPNCYEWIVTELAAIKAGLVLVCINAAFQKKELEYCLSKVDCKAIVAGHMFKTQNYYQLLCDITKTLHSSKPGELNSHVLPNLSHVIVISSEKLPGTFSFNEVSQLGGNLQVLDDIEKHAQFDEPVLIIYTSGTTGYPKAATLSHHNVVNNIYLMGNRGRYNPEFRSCCPIPLYHCFGSVVAVLMNIMYGCYNVFPSPRFYPEETLAAIHNEKLNNLYVTPTMIIDILNHPNIKNYDLSLVKTGIIGGSCVADELIRRIIDIMPNFVTAYGATETSPVTFMTTTHDPIDKRIKTVGKVMPHTEAKIIDRDGKVVGINTNGELCLRGYVTMLEYWKDEEKTKEVVTKARWYKSGDIACMDEDGYVQITGRIRDLIIRGGTNIYPIEVEQFLYTHPAIEEAQICGVPDDRMGEEVCAWIRIKQGMTLTEKEVKDFCKGQIAHYKIPRYVLFVQEFPLAGPGKVQKYIMQEQSKQMLNLQK